MGLLDRLRGLFSGGKASAAHPAPNVVAPPPAAAAAIPEADALPEEASAPAEPDLDALSFARRDAFWATVGVVETDVLSHLISPGLMGGPAWPTTRQAYRIVRRDGTTLIATDGMSDPFADGGDVNGFECELFIETADLSPDVAGSVGVIDPIKHSWAFELLSNVAGTIANAGGARVQFDRYGALSMEVPGVSQSTAIKAALPEKFATSDDALGLLIGGPAPDFPEHITDMPLSPVRLIPLVLLTAAELGEIRAGDSDTRDALVNRLAATPTAHRSSLTRPSVV